MITEYFFSDKEQLFAALVDECEATLHKATEEGQQTSVLVSGGSTPKPLYQRLSTLDINWSNVNVALVDERWVEEDHPGSNTTFIRENLLQNRAAEAKFIAMKFPTDSAESGWYSCEQAYHQLPRPYALTILGMGADGHTASLFPAAQGLQGALEPGNRHLCTPINATPSEVTGELTERMSLSLFGLQQSQALHLLITGPDKLAVYQQALKNSNHSLMPISAVLQQEVVPVFVYWAP